MGLHLEQVTHPFPDPELGGVRARLADLVHPVRRDACFRDLVHLLGADLHLDGGSERTEERRVQGLVAVRLGDCDVVLEPLRHRFVQTVHGAQHAIAVVGPLDDDPESVDVEHLLERQPPGAHLAIQAVEVLLPALDAGGDAFLTKPALHRRLDLPHDPLSVSPGLPDLGVEHLVAPWIECLESEVLQLDSDASKPEPIGDGRVDFDRLARDAAALVQRKRIEGAHVVKAVGELDQHHPYVAGHRHQHLAEVLRLRLGPALEGEVGELAHSVDELGHGFAELGRDLRLGGRGVLDDVVEERGDDRLVIEAHVREDLRNVQGVVDVGLARSTALLAVRVCTEQEGAMDLLDLRRLEVGTGKASQIVEAEHVRLVRTPATASPAALGVDSVRGSGRPAGE